MSGGALDYNQYHIGQIADQIKEEFLTLRERRLKAVYISLSGKRREERHTCKPATLRILRDAYMILREAAIYAQRVDWWLSGDDGEDSLQERLAEELSELRQENLSLRHPKPIADEKPEDDIYREVAKGVWASVSKGMSFEVMEKLRMGYHELRKGEHRRCCETCASFHRGYWECTRMHNWVSRKGVCTKWADSGSPQKSI